MQKMNRVRLSLAAAALQSIAESQGQGEELNDNTSELNARLRELQAEMCKPELPKAKAGVSPYAKFDKLHRKHRKK